MRRSGARIPATWWAGEVARSFAGARPQHLAELLHAPGIAAVEPGLLNGEQAEVRELRDRDGAAVCFRMERHTRQRRVAAITRPDDARPRGIHVSGSSCGRDAIQEIRLHLVGPLAAAGLLERLAETPGPAELGLQDRVAPRGEELSEEVEFVGVAGGRSAMRQDDERSLGPLRRGAGRQRQIGRHLQAIARLVGDPARGPQRRALQLRVFVPKRRKLLPRLVEQVPDRRRTGRSDPGDVAAAVRRPAPQLHSPVLEEAAEGGVHRADFRVQPFDDRAFAAGLDTHRGVADIVPHQHRIGRRRRGAKRLDGPVAQVFEDNVVVQSEIDAIIRFGIAVVGAAAVVVPACPDLRPLPGSFRPPHDREGVGDLVDLQPHPRFAGRIHLPGARIVVASLDERSHPRLRIDAEEGRDEWVLHPLAGDAGVHVGARPGGQQTALPRARAGGELWRSPPEPVARGCSWTGVLSEQRTFSTSPCAEIDTFRSSR